MKKVLSLLLAILMLSTTLIACADSADTPANDTTVPEAETTDAPETADPTVDANGYELDSLPPDLKFDGETFTIFSWSEFQEELFVESPTGEIVNDSVFKRNARVAERLGIEFNFIAEQRGDYNHFKDFCQKVNVTVNTNNGEYDLISSYNLAAPLMMLNHNIINLADVEHIDLEKPWWPKTIVEETEIDGNYYFLTGDASIGLIKWLYCMYFNKELTDKFQVGDLYQIVLDGKWTLEKLETTVTDIYEDYNQNGLVDNGDVYGLIARGDGNTFGFVPSCDLAITSRDGEGLPVISFGTEKVIDVFNRVTKLFNGTPGVKEWTDYDSETFVNAQAMIVAAYFGYSRDYLTNVEFEYGVIPYPKYDEDQVDYRTHIGNEYSFYSIPIDARNYSMSGAVLEALASESYRTVTPAYFESALKVRYAKDSVTGQMLDLMRQNASFNFGSIYAEQLSPNPNFQWRDYVTSNKTNWASMYSSISRVWTRNLERIIDTIREGE